MSDREAAPVLRLGHWYTSMVTTHSPRSVADDSSRVLYTYNTVQLTADEARRMADAVGVYEERRPLRLLTTWPPGSGPSVRRLAGHGLRRQQRHHRHRRFRYAYGRRALASATAGSADRFGRAGGPSASAPGTSTPACFVRRCWEGRQQRPFPEEGLRRARHARGVDGRISGNYFAQNYFG